MSRYGIIYEDDWLMALDKPSGMLVIPTPRGETNTLTDLVNADLDKRGVSVNAYPCHRLDRETSGLVVYAKGKKSQRLMMDEFRKRAVKKLYIAFAHGIVRNDYDIIRSHIYNRNKKRDEPAVTRIKVIGRRRDFSILEVEPVTGRTNQIRIHLSRIGHPILGESVYAFRKDYRLRFKRTALHAHRLEFTHPVTKARLSLVSSLARDMQERLSG